VLPCGFPFPLLVLLLPPFPLLVPPFPLLVLPLPLPELPLPELPLPVLPLPELPLPESVLPPLEEPGSFVMISTGCSVGTGSVEVSLPVDGAPFSTGVVPVGPPNPGIFVRLTPLSEIIEV